MTIFLPYFATLTEGEIGKFGQV